MEPVCDPYRTFLGLEVSAGHAQLAEIMKMVDKTMIEFRLDTFYKVIACDFSGTLWIYGDKPVVRPQNFI